VAPDWPPMVRAAAAAQVAPCHPVSWCSETVAAVGPVDVRATTVQAAVAADRSPVAGSDARAVCSQGALAAPAGRHGDWAAVAAAEVADAPLRSEAGCLPPKPCRQEVAAEGQGGSSGARGEGRAWHRPAEVAAAPRSSKAAEVVAAVQRWEWGEAGGQVRPKVLRVAWSQKVRTSWPSARRRHRDRSRLCQT